VQLPYNVWLQNLWKSVGMSTLWAKTKWALFIETKCSVWCVFCHVVHALQWTLLTCVTPWPATNSPIMRYRNGDLRHAEFRVNCRCSWGGAENTRNDDVRKDNARTPKVRHVMRNYSTVALVLPISIPLWLEWYKRVDNSTGAFRRYQTSTVLGYDRLRPWE